MRGGLEDRAVPSGQRLGSAIVATFGLVYVEVNAGALPSVIAGVARIVGAVLFIVVAALLLAGRHSSPTDGTPARQGFGRGYWVVVGVEVAAIVVGARLLTGPLGLPHGVVPTVISPPDATSESLGPRLATNRPETVESTLSIAAIGIVSNPAFSAL